MNGKKYITCDPSGKGKDKTIIRVWDGYECIKKVIIQDTDQAILEAKLRELSQQYKIPMRRICVDANGIGAGVRDRLRCIAFVSQSSPMKKHKNDPKPNYGCLRDQCVFLLADIVNE